MGILDADIDEAAYASLEWQALIEDVLSNQHRWGAASRILAKAREIEDAEPLRSKALSVIGGAISMRLVHASPLPFAEMMRVPDGRSMSMEDLGEYDFNLLARAARDTNDPWLRARLGDLAVSGSRTVPPDWRLGKLTVEAYLGYVESVFMTDRAVDGLDECRRALTLLWVYAKKDSALWDRVWSAIEHQVAHAVASNWPGVAFALCDEAKDRNRSICGPLAAVLNDKAESLVDAAPHEAERYYDYAGRLWNRIGDDARYREALGKQGEAMVAAAAQAANQQPLIAPHRLIEGISILRRARAQPARIAELRDLLTTYERASLDAFQGSEFKLDVSEWVAFIEAQIIGPGFLGALLQMAFRAGQWLDYEALRAEVLQSADEHPLSSFFSTQHSNDAGVVVATQEALDRNDEASIYSHMVKHARDYHLDARAKVLVRHATDLLYTHYQPPFFAVKEIVDASPITPAGHSETIARGLYAGIINDWVAASVYLIPAMEPFVRTQLQRVGTHTTIIREDGTQQEKNLAELLAMAEAEKFFGKGLILELRTLLTESIGYKLRHQYCHGLLQDRALQNAGIMSLWWCLWRMLLVPWHDHPSLAASRVVEPASAAVPEALPAGAAPSDPLPAGATRSVHQPATPSAHDAEGTDNPTGDLT